MRTNLMMLYALATAMTASSSARSVMNFARHFTLAMLPGPAALGPDETVMCPVPGARPEAIGKQRAGGDW